jgi:tRNA nucleotidyltransferase/poly(A) polymerase
MTIRIFEVGGSIRDQVMGVVRTGNADRDFCAVCPGGWAEMLAWCNAHMSKVFLVTPEFLTVRGIIGGEPIDLVLCRKDGASTDGRHPDEVEPGTLEDDLARRDFTVNALAIEVDVETLEPFGEIVDLFGGAADAETKTLRCIGSAEARFGEDGLRVLRAIRFWIKNGLEPDDEIMATLMGERWAEWMGKTVKQDRIREELHKCLKADTVGAIRILGQINPMFVAVCFGGEIWLKPTTEKR